MAAGVALLDMPAECRRSAALDRAHHRALVATERLSVRFAVGGADLAKDVCALEPPEGAQGAPQKCTGGLGALGTTGAGSQSNGLVVAHTVLVATFR